MKFLKVISFVIFFGIFVYSDELVTELRNEFRNAGVRLRLDRDERLLSDTKVFDGFIVDPARAFECGIRSPGGEEIDNGKIAYFLQFPNGELRQIYPGHIILKRRYRESTKENLQFFRVLITSEQRKNGIKICDPALIDNAIEDKPAVE